MKRRLPIWDPGPRRARRPEPKAPPVLAPGLSQSSRSTFHDFISRHIAIFDINIISLIMLHCISHIHICTYIYIIILHLFRVPAVCSSRLEAMKSAGGAEGAGSSSSAAAGERSSEAYSSNSTKPLTEMKWKELTETKSEIIIEYKIYYSIIIYISYLH